MRINAWEMDLVDAELVAKMVVIESRFRALHQYLIKEPQFLLALEEQAETDALEKSKEDGLVATLFNGSSGLVDKADLAALNALLSSGQKRFNHDDQRDQIASY